MKQNACLCILIITQVYGGWTTPAGNTVNTSTKATDYEESFIDLFDKQEENRRRDNDIVLSLNLPYNYEHQMQRNIARFYGAAAAMAIRDINNNQNLLSGYRLRYTWNEKHSDTNCVESHAIRRILDQTRMNLNVSGYIGFEEYCKVPAKMAGSLNLPLFSGVSFA